MVKGVPLFVCMKALEHFGENVKEPRHGFVRVGDRSIDFLKPAVACEACRLLMDDIDFGRRA